MPADQPSRPRRHAPPGVLAVTGALLGAGPALGQSPPPRGPVLTSRDLTVLGAAVVVAGGLVPFDTRISRWSQRPALHRNGAVRVTAAALRAFGDPGTVVLGGATYGVGLLAERRATAAVGLHTVAAVTAGSIVTGTIKYAVGRARPFVTDDSVATDVAFGRGLRGNDYQSLPSGHATAAFAFAGALAAEGRHRWRTVNRVTGPAGFAVAGLVAASRVYHDRHWASDVVLGSGIGAVAGAAVVRYVRAHPGNTLDRRLLPRRAAVAPSPVVSWTVRF